jgi:hypothetical protein
VCLSNRPGLSLDQQPNQVSGVLVDESEPSMNDNSASEPGMADDALKLAKSAVDSASAHVDEIARHFFSMQLKKPGDQKHTSNSPRARPCGRRSRCSQPPSSPERYSDRDIVAADALPAADRRRSPDR